MNDYDITITLLCDKRNARWGYQTHGFPFASRFACGHLHLASNPTLLAFALASALKAVSPHLITKYVFQRDKCGSYGEAKKQAKPLKVLVKTLHLGFYTGLASDEQQYPGVAANIRSELRKELKRFDVSCFLCDETETKPLFQWLKVVLPAASFSDGFPRPEQLRTA